MEFLTFNVLIEKPLGTTFIPAISLPFFQSFKKKFCLKSIICTLILKGLQRGTSTCFPVPFRFCGSWQHKQISRDGNIATNLRQSNAEPQICPKVYQMAEMEVPSAIKTG